jgi:hypothetical protein
MMRKCDVSVSFFLALAVMTISAAQDSPSTSNQGRAAELVPFERDGKWGFADRTGKIVITPQFTKVGEFSEGLAPAALKVPVPGEDNWGYVDMGGKMVIHPQFSQAGPFSEGLALVWSGGARLRDPVVKDFVKMGYIDKTGRWVIHSRFKYYFFEDFSSGLIPFRKNGGKWGYMDRTGKITIRPQFDWAGRFSGEEAPVLLNDRCARIDKIGKFVDTPESGDSSGTAAVPRAEQRTHHGLYQYKPPVAPCP